MSETKSYDAAIVGGGLAGLSLAIQLAKQGFHVVLFEKETYPFHRVCGEYISLESWPHLERLGMPLQEMDLPRISSLLVSSPNGNFIQHRLPLGGFGISRYRLDSDLALIARKNGVDLREGTRVTDITELEDRFYIQANSAGVEARIVAGCFGKRSNLDLRWDRPFIRNKPNKLNNFIGVKYHLRTDYPKDQIVLHNFDHGYAGFSAVEGEKYCFCYLTNAGNLKRFGNQIEEMEMKLLARNPFIRELFDRSERVSKEPVVISQVSFEKKSVIEHRSPMVGDAAGMIAPLCGNGMSMALHASKLAAGTLTRYLEKKITLTEMANSYQREWNILFARRLQTGRRLQYLFGKTWLTNLFLQTLKPFPIFIDYLIRQTHGQPF